MVTLTQGHVKNFQSVADVTVDFGKFTVMVGQSNSGKSAFLRGVRSCVRNSFVPSNVKQGTSKSEVDLYFDDAQVSIERGKSLSTYKMNNGADVFTKSARAVPEEVEAQLKFPLISSIDPFFSFQFDKPFLLSETGSVAAQVLGSLTNVSLLHQSVREANRRRQEVLNVIKIREQDVRNLQLDFESYRDLPLRRDEIDQVQHRFDQVLEQQKKVDDLTTAVDVVRSSQQLLDSLSEFSLKNFTEEISHLRELNGRIKSLTLVTKSLERLTTELKDDVRRAKTIKQDMDLTKESYHDRLKEIGECPMCHQDTKHLTN